VSRSTRYGFTFVELLVVLFIIVILLGLLLPAVRRVRDPANRMSCQNNLHQMALALANYESSYGKFPTGCIGPGEKPEERLSWMVALLPYMEQDPLYKQIDVKKGYAQDLQAVQTRMKGYQCPGLQPDVEANTAGFTTYIALSGIGLDAATQPVGTAGNGFMGYDRLTKYSMIKDGSSNTISLVETRSSLGPWARGGSSNVRGFDPADLPFCGDQRPFGGHQGGMNTAFADGSAHLISSSINPDVLSALITIDGGEKITAEMMGF
jgi:prepilin-type N-terminal cleavage/methylation domain-containing protein/prepilin-type processing-associated H-X9-DG protein